MVVRKRSKHFHLHTGLTASVVAAAGDSSSSLSSDADTVPFPPPRHRKPSRLPLFLVLVIALAARFLHSGHVATLHDSHLSFALLSNRERELTFFTEMGFYYSFYKQIILADSISSGIASLFNDTLTEYPSQFGCLNNSAGEHGYLPDAVICSSSESGKAHSGINVLERFNVYPEVLLAAAYRLAHQWRLLSSQCFQVSLGDVDEVHALAVPPKDFGPLNHQNRSQTNATSLAEIGTGAGRIVLSCDGLREPPTFYVNVVYFLAGFTTLGLSLSGWLVANGGLSNPCLSHAMIAIWGAILPVCAFFFNHREATRVQWAPPLRESFSYPFFVLQQTALLWLLKDSSRTRPLHLLKCLLFILLLLAVQLPWQFAQFALLTQLLALLGAYVIALQSRTPYSTPLLRLFSAFVARLEDLIFYQLIALLLCFCAQFGNQLLLLSLYFPLLIGSLAGIIWHRRRLDSAISINSTPWSRSRFGLFAHLVAMAARILAVSALVAVVTRLVLLLMRGSSDDGAHILDLLRVKLLGPAYRTFHTQLYTCSDTFDFLPIRVLKDLTSTGLLPGSVLAVLVSVLMIVWPRIQQRSVTSDQSTEKSPFEGCESPLQLHQLPAKEVSLLITDLLSIFVVLQLAAFALLAGMIMRLKLFFVPQLCLSLAILAQPRLFFGSHKLLRLFVSGNSSTSKSPKRKASASSPWPTSALFCKVIGIYCIFIVFHLLSAIKGWRNLQDEWGKIGEFSDPTKETLLNWATSLPARPDNRPWVFSGPMPIMATLRLGLITSAGELPGAPLNAKFAITNHPHYENELLRTRTLLAYSLASRKPLVSIWSIYRYALTADFVVVQQGWCINPHAEPGCTSSEIWDLQDPAFSHRGDSPCSYVFTSDEDLSPEDSVRAFEGYFRPVFRSLDHSIVVLEVARRPFLFAV